mgnify:CR=1 FL=1
MPNEAIIVLTLCGLCSSKDAGKNYLVVINKNDFITPFHTL